MTSDKEIIELTTGTGDQTDRTGKPINNEAYIPIGQESDSIIEEVGVLFDEEGAIVFRKQKVHQYTNRGRFITGPYQKHKKK